MKHSILILTAAVALLSLAGCDEQEQKGTTTNAPQAEEPTAKIRRLTVENAKLKAEVVALRKRVDELSLTPSVLLAHVTEALTEDRSAEARQASKALDTRFAESSQAKAARVAIAKYDAAVKTREAQAMALEARGFYALQAQNAPTADGIRVRVESIKLGGRWTFDAHGDEWQYRDAERGEHYVLLLTTFESTEKNPNLPDVGIYRIDGKKMMRLAQMEYEFRRWSSFGTFIGLYHDFKNDFAYTKAIPFNAAASISDEDAKKLFVVVVTGNLCHERGSKIGQPEVRYSLSYDCASKSELNISDFTKGGYRVLAFFNRPKGS